MCGGGEKCTEAPPECPAPCQHGTCNRLQGICACDDGWEGGACENPAGTAAAVAKAISYTVDVKMTFRQVKGIHKKYIHTKTSYGAPAKSDAT